MSTVAELTDRIAGLTIAQAAAVRQLLKERYGIEPAGFGSVGTLPKPDLPPPQAESVAPTEFDVILEGADPARKINVIRLVRELTGQGLAEAKATTEGGPKPIREGVDRQTAEDVRKKLEDAGARVSVRPV